MTRGPSMKRKARASRARSTSPTGVAQKQSAGGFPCEWPGATAAPVPDAIPEKPHGRSRSRIMRFRGDFTWSEGLPRDYKPEKHGWEGVRRQELVGALGDPTAFHLRYFEIGPGGYSSLERHQHAHAITAIRGKGKVIVGGRTHGLEFLDTVYIAPGTPHQLRNEGREPFGFFCTVDAVRDRPQPLGPATRRLR